MIHLIRNTTNFIQEITKCFTTKILTKMLQLKQLQSFHIIEKCNNQNIMSWTFPTIDQGIKNIILSKISNISLQFYYFRVNNLWIYQIKDENYSLVIITSDFCVEKYRNFGKILSRTYTKTKNPVDLVKLYLDVYTKGFCNTLENGVFSFSNFDNNLKIKELIHMFSLEIILIYTAILLKKRIILYHHNPQFILEWIPTILSLVPHRKPSDFLFPIMNVNKDDFCELQVNKYYIAGFTDISICQKSDLYDILVNFAALEINISPNSKESLQMSKIHKDIAIFMTQLSENSNLNNKDVLNEINNKTVELIDYCKTFFVDGEIIPEKIKNVHPYVEMFIVNLANCENIVHILK